MQTHSISFSLSISIAAAAAATACTTEPHEPPPFGECWVEDGPDGTSYTCRSCAVDPDCGSGVCLEATGTCARPAGVIHVAPGGADSGACTRGAPCRTLQYAMEQVTPSRDVIRVAGDRLAVEAPIVIDRPVVIDGTGTAIEQPAGGPTFVIEAHAGAVTMEGLQLHGALESSDPTVTVARGSTLQIRDSVLLTAVVDVDGGALELLDAKLTTALHRVESVRCTGGTVRVRGAVFEHAMIRATDCHLNVSRSRFYEVSDGSIGATGGVAVVENNLIVQAYELSDTMYLTQMGPGSAVRFNTFVNTSGRDSDGVALYCDGTLPVTSNIFAYGSKHPLGPPMFRCPAKFSLFDKVAVVEQTVGEGNMVRDAATFFVDRAHGDYHLAGDSPARSASEPGLTVALDLEGNPRPVPVGSRADLGAFEAP